MKYLFKLGSISLILFLVSNMANAQWNSGTNVQHTDDQVGIGTDSPDQKLTIVGTGEDVSHYSYSSDMPKSSPNYKFYRARGINTAPLIVTDSIEFGSLIWYGYNGSAFKAGAELVTVLDGTPSGNHMPSKLIFRTSSSGGFVNRMVIDANGRMGINLSAPDEKLHVDGNIKQEPGQTLITDNIKANTNASSLLKLDNGTWATGATSIASKSNVSIGLDYNNNGTNGEFIIGTDDEDPTGANWISLFTVKESGEVGIGTSTPSEKLEVNGSLMLNSAGNHIKQVDSDRVYSEHFITNNGKGAGWMINAQYSGSGDPQSNATFTASTAYEHDPAAGYLDFDGNAEKWRFFISEETTGVGNQVTFDTKMSIDKNAVWFSPRGTEADFRIGSSGRIGIGTTTPNYKLHVEENSVDASAALFEFTSTAVPTGGGAGITLRNNDLTDNSISSINFEGDDPDGNSRYMAKIVVGKEPGWIANSNTTYKSYLSFWTRSGSAQQESVRITHDGKMGIGISNPSTELDVAGTINASNYLINGAPLQNWTQNEGDITFSGDIGLNADGRFRYYNDGEPWIQYAAGTNDNLFYITRSQTTGAEFSVYSDDAHYSSAYITVGDVTKISNAGVSTLKYGLNILDGDYSQVNIDNHSKMTLESGLGTHGAHLFLKNSMQEWGLKLTGEEDLKIVDVTSSQDKFVIDHSSGDFSFHDGNIKLDNDQFIRFKAFDGTDDQTGIRRRTGDALSIAYATNQLRIDALNNNPVNIRSSNEDVKISFHPAGDSYFTGGKVGIGTETPFSNLEISNGAESTLRLSRTGGHSALDPIGIIDFYEGNYDNAVSSRIEGTRGPGGMGRGELAFSTLETSGGSLQERMRISYEGKVGIGTSTPDELLTVDGTIHAERVKVDLIEDGPDYVFEEDYDLMSLENTSKYIKENKHLPHVPSAKEMKEEGVNVGDMNMILLRKVEELTLYILEQNDKINELQEKVEELEKQ